MEDTKQDMQRQQQAQMLYNKGFTAFERGSYDIAIDLLMKSLTMSPGFERARKLLHQVQMIRFRKAKKGSFSMKMAEMGVMGKKMKVPSLIKAGKAEEALAVAEELLAVNPTNAQFLEAYFSAARAADRPEAVLVALEVLTEYASDDDLDLTLRMGHAYAEAGLWDKARDCYAKVNALNPSDLSVLKLLKDADAKNTMTAGGWEDTAGKAGGYRDLIRDKEQAKKLDTSNKTVVSGDDADEVVRDLKEKIAREPKNINFYRALARTYTQNKRFDEALEILGAAREINATDPELDRTWSSTKTLAYESKIETLRAAGDEEGADAMEEEKCQFVFDDLVRRVEQYPNDTHLHFELGKQYFMYEAYDDAIQQFQFSQRSPKDRLESLYYLASSFKEKGQADMAVMQLETANGQLQVMDDLKKRVVYLLGMIAEEQGQLDKAFEYYKEVYASDISFEDIGERMERVYKARQSQG